MSPYRAEKWSGGAVSHRVSCTQHSVTRSMAWCQNHCSLPPTTRTHEPWKPRPLEDPLKVTCTQAHGCPAPVTWLTGSKSSTHFHFPPNRDNCGTVAGGDYVASSTYGADGTCTHVHHIHTGITHTHTNHKTFLIKQWVSKHLNLQLEDPVTVKVPSQVRISWNPFKL